jgi:hypothetical protein
VPNNYPQRKLIFLKESFLVKENEKYFEIFESILFSK